MAGNKIFSWVRFPLLALKFAGIGMSRTPNSQSNHKGNQKGEYSVGSNVIRNIYSLFNGNFIVK